MKIQNIEKKTSWIKVLDFALLVPATMVKLLILTLVMYFAHRIFIELNGNTNDFTALKIFGLLGLTWVLKDWIHYWRLENEK